MAIALSYNLKSLWARRTTTLATAAGIGMVVFVLASSLMLARGLKKTLLDAGSEDKAIVMQLDTWAEGNSRVRQSVLALALAAPGVRRGKDGLPMGVGEAVTDVILPDQSDASRQASVQVRGVTSASFRLRPEVRLVEGRQPSPGTDEAMVGTAINRRYAGVRLGQGFDLGTGRKLRIVGVFAASGSAYESEVWADLDTVRSSLGWEGYLSSVTIRLASASAYDGFAIALSSDKRQGLSIERERAYYEKLSRFLSRAIAGLGTVVSFIFSFGAMLGAAITMYAAVSQRRRELGVLRAIGFRRGHILLGMLAETAMVGLLGAAAGLALALLTPLLDFSTANWATGQELTFRFVPGATVLCGSGLVGVAVGVLGGLFPALRAARMDPVAAMRE